MTNVDFSPVFVDDNYGTMFDSSTGVDWVSVLPFVQHDSHQLQMGIFGQDVIYSPLSDFQSEISESCVRYCNTRLVWDWVLEEDISYLSYTPVTKTSAISNLNQFFLAFGSEGKFRCMFQQQRWLKLGGFMTWSHHRGQDCAGPCCHHQRGQDFAESDSDSPLNMSSSTLKASLLSLVWWLVLVDAGAAAGRVEAWGKVRLIVLTESWSWRNISSSCLNLGKLVAVFLPINDNIGVLRLTFIKGVAKPPVTPSSLRHGVGDLITFF